MKHAISVVTTAAAALALTAISAAATPQTPPPNVQVPVVFEENRGQTHGAVQFVARVAGGVAFFTDEGVVFAREGAPATTMRFCGAAPGRWDPARGTGGASRYCRGAEPTIHAAHFAELRRALGAGVEVVFRASGTGTVVYDVELAPYADPTSFRVELGFIRDLAIDADGALVIATGHGTIRQSPPFAYQDTPAGRVEVESRFVLLGPSSYGFAVAEYDPALPLVIDPAIVLSTYLGGSASDVIHDIAVSRRDGRIYVTGATMSLDFPVTPGAPGPVSAGSYEVFVTCLDWLGRNVVYSTYLGGSYWDRGFGIAVDEQGYAYAAGEARSAGFPVRNPIQPALSGASDGFLAVLDPLGGLLFSTYLGGNGSDWISAITLRAQGVAVVTGLSGSSNFPVTANAFQSASAGASDCFVTIIDVAAGAIVYSTYLGGSNSDYARSVAVDAFGAIVVCGETRSPDYPVWHAAQPNPGGQQDGFVTRLDPDIGLLYSTFLGGLDDDRCGAVAVAPSGEAYVVGQSSSPDFPVTSGAFQGARRGWTDAVVTALSPQGVVLASTYYGGSRMNTAFDVAVDEQGRVMVVGWTTSQNLPLVIPLQANLRGGQDAFVAWLDPPLGTLLFATYLGGKNAEHGFCVATWHNACYIAGSTRSPDFPTLPGAAQPGYAGDGDGFVIAIQ